MLDQLSEFWLDRHHSDVQVDIIAPCGDRTPAVGLQQHALSGYARCEVDSSSLCPGCCSCAAANLETDKQHVLARVPCHRVLLSAASTYFAALLSPAWADGTTAGTRTVQVVLTDAEDVPAMVAVLKCIYTGDLSPSAEDLAKVLVYQQPSPIPATATAHYTSTAAASPAGHSCSCTAVPASLASQSDLLDVCWQELSVRVIRLADQFSVSGVMKAAAGRLSCLFSYQLSWPAVLAVLWLPAALAQQPLLKELRQMAINRVTQDMKHLDPCLASSYGRSVLQHLPADALATLLSSDQLALVSENSTLAAIDIWLAGPVASALSLMPATQGSCLGPCYVGCDSMQHQEPGLSLMDITAQQQGSSKLLSGVHSPSEAAQAMDGTTQQPVVPAQLGDRLAGALQLLLRQVRLPLCSGAFLAAAVSQRPWLCVGLRGSHDLQLMQQYYSLDSQGRYDLAMKLLRSGASCPWSVLLRRGLPSTFNANTSSIHRNKDTSSSSSSSSSSKPAAAYTGLSQIKAILLSSTTATPDTSSRSSSSSLTSDSIQLGKSSRSSSTCSSDVDLSQTKQQPQQQQQQPGKKQLQQIDLTGGGTALGIMIHEKVLGGYFWQMALVAVPLPDSYCSSCAADSCTEGAVKQANQQWSPKQQQKQQLCLSIKCQPAWADVLDANSPDYDAAVVHKAVPAAASGLATGGEGHTHHTAACGAVLHPTSAAAAATAPPDGSASGSTADGCVTCEALWSIAGAKAAEAIARHVPLGSVHEVAAAVQRQYSCHCEHTQALTVTSGSHGSRNILAEAHGHQVASSNSNSTNNLQGPALSAAAAADNTVSKLAHLDVVVGVQLVACSSLEQLQQLTGDGPGSISSSNQGSLAQTHVPCLLGYDAATGAAHALLPVDVRAINTGSNMLQSRVDGAVGFSGVSEGWQPELWSMLAPNGALHWFVSLRPLMD